MLFFKVYKYNNYCNNFICLINFTIGINSNLNRSKSPNNNFINIFEIRSKDTYKIPKNK